MRERLTEALLDILRPADRDQFVFDTMLSGFGYRLTPAGTGVFFVGKPRRTVGRRADLSAAEAREKAREMLVDIRQGKDPHLERRAREQAMAAGSMTVRQLAEQWMTQYVRPKLKPRTVADYEKLLAKHILPTLGHLTVAGLARADVTALHVSMKETPRRANYTVRTIQGMMTYACDNGLRPPLDNPVRKLKLFREAARERFLSEEEIGAAADAIRAAERDRIIGPHAAAGLRLALFTGARSGEITAVEWRHIDWQRRFIRLPDSKTNEPRTIHLSDAAIEVLKTLPRVSKFVIAGAKSNEAYKNLSRAWIKVRDRTPGLEDVRLHDLRHSYASLAAGQGVSLQMIGKLLGHKVPATTQRYAHLARDAVAAVNDQLGVALMAAIDRKPPDGAKIIKMRRRGRK